jgi:Xaa-Pro aminopeptidase
LREEITKKKAKAMVVNMLDEVAWLFNLRGADIDFNPGGYAKLNGGYNSNSPLFLQVFFSYSVITHDKAILFIDSAQIDDVVRKHLDPDVEIRPYDTFFQYLKTIGDSLELKGDGVRL